MFTTDDLSCGARFDRQSSWIASCRRKAAALQFFAGLCGPLFLTFEEGTCIGGSYDLSTRLGDSDIGLHEATPLLSTNVANRLV